MKRKKKSTTSKSRGLSRDQMGIKNKIRQNWIFQLFVLNYLVFQK